METTLRARKVFVNPIYKDKATVLKTVDETGGKYMLAELIVYPGGGNTMHSHRAFEETFTSVAGKLGVVLHNEKHYLLPGESITVPLNAPHYFFNDGNDPVTCTVKFTPGHEGFVKGIAIAYGLAADGKTNKKGIPKNFIHLSLIVVLTDTKPAGFLGKLFPIFKLFAALAKKNGTEDLLLKQYYYS